jgi:hypothetical protein
MAMPPGIGGDIPDGDRKRLMQRADTFAIGTGTREIKDRDDAKEFDETLEEINKPRVVKSAEEDVEKQARETEEYRRDQLMEQAEKRGSSSPPPNLYPGCLTLPGIGVPMLVLGEASRGESKGRSGGVESAGEKVLQVVSQEVLQGLREAGLPDPVQTLDDPRLGKSPDGLKDSFSMSLRGHERVYVWSSNGCHQILTIGLNETKVESAAGPTVETLRRTGNGDEKSVAQRTAPEGSFIPIDDADA